MQRRHGLAVFCAQAVELALGGSGRSERRGDLLDTATLGLGAIVPANIKAYGSYFTSGLERRSASGAMCAQISGYGGGAGLGAGWGLPLTASLMGETKSIKAKVLENLLGSVDAKITDFAKGPGWGGGTPIVAGPDSRGDLALADFHGMHATICGLGANFVVNGVSFGLIVMAKKRPVVRAEDLIYARAIGLMGCVGLSISLDIEASNMIYDVRVAAA